MSEPTKEQIERVMDFLGGEGCFDPSDDEDRAFAERICAEVLLPEIARALAPPAQTQQGLSEEKARWSILGGGHDKRNVDIVTPDGDVVAEVFGNPAHLETAQQRAEAICAARNLSAEKQPSPAAAPAQLSEVLAQGFQIARDNLIACGNESLSGMGVDLDWSAAEAELQKAVAALAGQPAPTDDQKALRAAALEEAAQLAETWGHAPPNPHGRRAALASAIRALAGSPAQQGQLGKKGGG